MYRVKAFGDSYFESIRNFYTIGMNANSSILYACRNTSFRLFMQ